MCEVMMCEVMSMCEVMMCEVMMLGGESVQCVKSRCVKS